MAEVTGGGLTVKVDADDIEHLIKKGTSTVTGQAAGNDVQVKVRCDEEIAVKAEALTDD